MIISLTYKYILILAETVSETYMAMKSRLIIPPSGKTARALAGGRLFFIFRRSRQLYENTYMAMVSRGYDGKINSPGSMRLTLTDGVILLLVALFGVALFLIH
jgi:energy-coupling factor transporter transmembrane protein EcfT